ncbi:MAG: hypothetical protein RLZZ265_2289, partial [Verrucomicrobiota bacterium]
RADLDASALFVTGTTDALQNRTTATLDYRVLSPRRMEDPNGARSEVSFDVLGRVLSLAERGHSGEGGVSARFAYDLSRPGGRPALARAWLRQSYATDQWDQSVVYSDGSGAAVLTKVQAESEQDGGPLRWVGTGRTVLDNKGNPVKQYEPYFAPNDGYDTEASLVQTGVTPILRYDPVGRLVRTDHPDGSYERVERTPWSERQWDANDTSSEPDHLWAQTRLVSTKPDERASAQAAQTHRNTPGRTLLDSQGRPFLTEQDNGSFTLPGETRPYRTRQVLDVEGNVLQVLDPRDEGNVLLTQTFDALGRPLRQVSVDSGTHWTVPDVAGKPILSGDGRRFRVQVTYDELRRPLERRVWDPGTQGLEIRERLWYGEALGEDAVKTYHRGRVWRTGDGAGRIDVVRHDFKGQPLETVRRLWRGASLPRWPDPGDTLLEGAFTTTTTYDAQGRPVEVKAADGGSEVRSYSPRGGLARITRDGKVYLSKVVYDAKGQRTRVLHGDGPNQVETRLHYDPLTFRLLRLRSTHADGRVFQDLNYTYDAVGNVLSRTDKGQQTIFFRNRRVDPVFAYTYDSLYRLIQATGREAASTEGSYGPDETGRFAQGIPQPADARALRLYEQRYIYDEIGNFKEMRHLVDDQTRWVRAYDYVPGTNRLLRTRLRGLGITGEETENCPPDLNGNMLALGPALTRLVWDDQDRLLQTEKQGQVAHYRYDGGGERVIKVRVAGQVTEERLYLGSVERWRRYADGALTDERWTWHGMDGYARFVMVEHPTKKDGHDLSTAALARYQLGDHLGSSHVEVSATGGVISYEEMHPYGTTALQLFNPSSGVSAKRYRYTGKERDEETGLNYHSARYYAPWLGRWCSCDPLGIVYTKPDPCSYSDCSPACLGDMTGLAPKASRWYLLPPKQNNIIVEPVEREQAINIRLPAKSASADPRTPREFAADTERKRIEDIQGKPLPQEKDAFEKEVLNFRAVSIMNSLISTHGFSPVWAAAMAGNMKTESKFDATRLQGAFDLFMPMTIGEKTYTVSYVWEGRQKEGGYGLVQWTEHARRVELRKWVERRHKETGRSEVEILGDKEEQLAFIAYELKTPGYLGRALKKVVWDYMESNKEIDVDAATKHLGAKY